MGKQLSDIFDEIFSALLSAFRKKDKAANQLF